MEIQCSSYCWISVILLFAIIRLLDIQNSIVQWINGMSFYYLWISVIQFLDFLIHNSVYGYQIFIMTLSLKHVSKS